VVDGANRRHRARADVREWRGRGTELSGVTSIDELVGTLRAARERLRRGDWLLG